MNRVLNYYISSFVHWDWTCASLSLLWEIAMILIFTGRQLLNSLMWLHLGLWRVIVMLVQFPTWECWRCSGCSTESTHYLDTTQFFLSFFCLFLPLLWRRVVRRSTAGAAVPICVSISLCCFLSLINHLLHHSGALSVFAAFERDEDFVGLCFYELLNVWYFYLKKERSSCILILEFPLNHRSHINTSTKNT